MDDVRFEAYASKLGDRSVARVPPDRAANRDLPGFFSGFVPMHLVDGAGQPTVEARDEILASFQSRLGAPTGNEA